MKNPLKSRFARATAAIGWRQLHIMLTKPQFLLPSLIMPVFFFTAFAGGLSAVSNNPNFDYAGNYTTFQFVFVLLQSAVFGGVFTGFSIASDFERGFARRMMLATRSRTAMITGYGIAAATRAMLTWIVVTTIALISGAQIDGSGIDLVSLFLMAILLNVSALLFACGMAMRMRTLQAAPLIQLPAFLLIMTAPVYVPRNLVEGWVGTVTNFNPLTALLESGRQLVIGGSAEGALVAAVIVGLLAVMGTWAVTGLRRAERAVTA